jgi:hypothetical protein
MKKAWDDLSFSEKLSIGLYYGTTRYIREYYEEQEQHQKMMTAVNNTVRLGEHLFRRHRGKK